MPLQLRRTAAACYTWFADVVRDSSVYAFICVWVGTAVTPSCADDGCHPYPIMGVTLIPSVTSAILCCYVCCRNELAHDPDLKEKYTGDRHYGEAAFDK